MQAVRDAALLLLLILVIASVRISPTPGLALTPSVEAGQSGETLHPVAGPAAAQGAAAPVPLVVPALRQAQPETPPAVERETICAHARHVVHSLDDGVVVLELEWTAERDCCEPGPAADCA